MELGDVVADWKTQVPPDAKHPVFLDKNHYLSDYLPERADHFPLLALTLLGLCMCGTRSPQHRGTLGLSIHLLCNHSCLYTWT